MKGETKEGNNRKLQNEVWGMSLVIQEVIYIKKRKDETDAVSFYKPHPHLKCPHMFQCYSSLLFLVSYRKFSITDLLHSLSHHHNQLILS